MLSEQDFNEMLIWSNNAYKNIDEPVKLIHYIQQLGTIKFDQQSDGCQQNTDCDNKPVDDYLNDDE
jgi:hypothetical protein